MVLWIRSQDKKKLSICYDIHYTFVTVSEKGYFVCINGQKFAEYKSEERALEVIDEIQKLLIGNIITFTNIDINEDMAKFIGEKCIVLEDATKEPQVEFLHRDCVVYEMPEE